MNYLQNIWNTLYLPSLLQSKRFWSAALGLAAIIIAAYQPGLEPYMPQFITAATVAIMMLVGGYSLQDAVAAGVNAYMEYQNDDD